MPILSKLWVPAFIILSLVSAWLTWQNRSNGNFVDYRFENWAFHECEGEEKPLKRVAVVGKLENYAHSNLQSVWLRLTGAGSSGASTAYYLDQFKSPCQPVNITIYERSDYVGGRSTTVNAYNDPSEPVEIGASIFVQVNRNLVSATHELGLTIKPSDPSIQTPKKMGVWDGQNFVFVRDESDYDWWNTAKLLWQYGLTPIRVHTLMKRTIGTFLKMYEKPYFPFRSLSKVALELGLTPLTSITGEEFLRQNSIIPPFSTDIVQASTRVNYAQNLVQIHGLETMVCMATDGAMAIEGGNWRIFDRMITRAQANLALNTTVHEIVKCRNGLFEVRSFKEDSRTASNNTLGELFDTVVIASPLEFSDIRFTPELEHVPVDVPYVELHVTLFTSPHKIASEMFGSAAVVPDVILTTVGQNNSGYVVNPGFFSVSTLRTIQDPPLGLSPQYLYKVFSPQQLDATFISQLLGFDCIGEKLSSIPKKDVSWIHSKVWHSYPYLEPRATFADLEVSPNIWYTSGIESFISTMVCLISLCNFSSYRS